MNQDKIRNLAIESMKNKPICNNPSVFSLTMDELAAYTAAVEARERERCAAMVDHILKEGGGTYGDAIRELK